MLNSTKNNNWYALYTKPKHEKKAVERLTKEGYEVFYPMIQTIKQWSDRKKKVSIPLIPSYIFIKVEEKNRSEVLKDPSILNYVYWLSKPAIIRDEEIDRLKGIISNDEIEEFEIRSLSVGDKINIDKGCFKDDNAVITKLSKNYIYAHLQELGMIIIIKKIDLVL